MMRMRLCYAASSRYLKVGPFRLAGHTRRFKKVLRVAADRVNA
jgi:hypothetical protein